MLRRSLTLATLALLLLAAPLTLAEGPIDWPQHGEPVRGEPGIGKRDAAVVIAIEEYDKLPWVLGAGQNGRDWVSWLNRARGIQLSRVRQVFAGADVETIRKQALAAARDVGPGGTLWFIFIGHGAPAPGLGGSVLVGQAAPKTEAGLSSPTYVLPRDGLLDELSAELARDARLVAVLDACFSGVDTTGEEFVSGLQGSSYREDSYEASKTTTLLVASSGLEYAGHLPGTTRPAFSYLLLGALRGWADDPDISGDGDGTVTVPEAVTYADTALRTALAGSRNQTPRLVGDQASADLLFPALEDGPKLIQSASEPASETVSSQDADPDWVRRSREARASQEAARRAEEEAARLRQEAEQERQRMREEALARRQRARRDSYTAAIEPLMADDAGDEALGVVSDWVEDAEADRVSVPGYDAPVRVPEVTEVATARDWLAARRRSSARPSARSGGVQAFTHKARGLSFSMVQLPKTTFQMGSPAGVGGASEHAPGDGTFSVTLSSYAMGTTEVTNAQYAAFLSDHGNKCGPTDCVDASSGSLELKESGGRWRPVAGFEDHPVVEVTWYGADAFAKWAGLALPTEAQWEAACRAGEQQTWSGTDTEARLSDYANLLGDSDGSSGLAPVGSLQSNGRGLYDLSGNVWEWTADAYGGYPAGPVTDPTGAASGGNRVIRGGSFGDSADWARCGYRNRYLPDWHWGSLGFRVVLTPAPQR